MEKGESSNLGNKPDRKTVEKNRRIMMKGLYSQLVSLVPNHHFNPPKKMWQLVPPSMSHEMKHRFIQISHGIKGGSGCEMHQIATNIHEYLSLQDQIDQTGAYIKILKDRIEELKRKKTNMDSTNSGESSKLPFLAIKELGADLEVVIISGPNKNFMLHRIICILEEEEAQVVTVSISTVGDKIFHTIHAQAKVARVGMDTSRISERIHELIS